MAASKKKASASTGNNESAATEESAPSVAAEMIRKITNKALFGAKPTAPEKEQFLGTVFGIARGVKSGESNNGPWTALTGSFEALTHDNRRLASPVCFLPEPLNSHLAEQVVDEEVESIQFGVDVYIVPSDVPIGYEYRAKMKIEPTGADPLADLRNKALPAPE